MVHTCICTGNTLYNVAPKSERASDFQTELFNISTSAWTLLREGEKHETCNCKNEHYGNCERERDQKERLKQFCPNPSLKL